MEYGPAKYLVEEGLLEHTHHWKHMGADVYSQEKRNIRKFVSSLQEATAGARFTNGFCQQFKFDGNFALP